MATEKRAKRPTALKRDLQNEKKRIENRSFKAAVSTALRGYKTALETKAGEQPVKEKLSAVYSLMDKGVKKGVFSKSKAARVKSRLTAKA